VKSESLVTNSPITPVTSAVVPWLKTHDLQRERSSAGSTSGSWTPRSMKRQPVRWRRTK